MTQGTDAGAQPRTSRESDVIVDHFEKVERVPLEARIAWTHHVVKHSVTVLLLAMLFLAPFIFIIAMRLFRIDGAADFASFFQTWFGVVAGLAGTAVGWYFRSKKEAEDG
jgi:hypothetical protein